MRTTFVSAAGLVGLAVLVGLVGLTPRVALADDLAATPPVPTPTVAASALTSDEPPSRLSLDFGMGYRVLTGDPVGRAGGVTLSLGVDYALTDDLAATFRERLIGADRLGGDGPTRERPVELQLGLGLRWQPQPWLVLEGELGTSQRFVDTSDRGVLPDPRAAASITLPLFCVGDVCLGPTAGVEVTYGDPAATEPSWYVGVTLMSRR